MTILAYRIPAMIATIVLSGSTFAVDDGARLGIKASVVDFKISSRANDRYAIKLPNLTFSLQVVTNCAGEQQPQSVLLSIADTRKRISREQLESGDTTVSITLPERQTAPLSIKDFCVLGDNSSESSNSGKTIAGAFSVQGALICADEASEQTVYASSPLDITVYCNGEEDPVDENAVSVRTPSANADAKN